MELYWLLWGIVICISFFDLCKINYSYKKIFMICVLLICVLMGGFRTIGTDWEQYYTYFMDRNTLAEFSDTHYGLYYEAGFIYLNYIIKCITDEYYGMLLFLTAAICFFKYKMITKISKGDLVLVILALNFSYYLGDFFPVRQNLAIAITIYSIIFIVKRDLFKFILIILVASLFHRSAIIFFPAYWIYYKDISNKKVIILIIISFLIGYTEIISKIVMLFSNIDITLIDKLIAYTERGELSESANIAGPVKLLFSFSKKIVLLLVFLYIKNKVQLEFYKGFFNFFLVSIVISLIFGFSAPEVSARAQVFYNFVEIFLVAGILKLSDKIKYKILIWSLIVIYCFVQYYYAIYKFYDIYVPYMSIFN